MNPLESSYNLPPGVSPNDPHLTGLWPCRECGRTLPEDPICPECAGAELDLTDADNWWCPICGFTADGDICPGGCGDE